MSTHKAVLSSQWKSISELKGCCLPYGITKCYLPPDTSKHIPP